MAQFFLYFTQNGVFSGTKMQKQKILQNLLIRLIQNLIWWQLWLCLKDPSLDFFEYKIDTRCLKYFQWKNIFHDAYHLRVGKSDFLVFLQKTFYYYPNWSILANQDCEQIFLGKILERTFVSFCKIFVELFRNEHITFDTTLSSNEFNLSFLSTTCLKSLIVGW